MMAALLSPVNTVKARRFQSGEGAGNPNHSWLSCSKTWVLPCISMLNNTPLPGAAHLEGNHPEAINALPSLDQATF